MFSQATNSKLYAYNTSMGNSKFNVWNASRLFFPHFEEEIEIIRGKQKLLPVSGKFELSRVRVTQGKITVNV